jgi:hypothetical protein
VEEHLKIREKKVWETAISIISIQISNLVDELLVDVLEGSGSAPQRKCVLDGMKFSANRRAGSTVHAKRQVIPVLVDSTSRSLETDIRNHGFSVYVVPIVVEVLRDIFDVAVRGCIWKEPAHPNFLSVYGLSIVTQPFTTDDPLTCRYHTSAVKVLKGAYEKNLEESTSLEVQKWLETQIAGLARHAVAVDTEPGIPLYTSAHLYNSLT